MGPFPHTQTRGEHARTPPSHTHTHDNAAERKRKKNSLVWLPRGGKARNRSLLETSGATWEGTSVRTHTHTLGSWLQRESCRRGTDVGQHRGFLFLGRKARRRWTAVTKLFLRFSSSFFARSRSGLTFCAFFLREGLSVEASSDGRLSSDSRARGFCEGEIGKSWY